MPTHPQNEALYQALVKNSPDAFMFSDFSGNILIANPRAAEMGGFEDATELIGLNLFAYVAEKDKLFVGQKFGALAKGVLKGTIEATLIRKDGTTYEAELTGSLIHDEKGIPIGLFSITRDVSDRKTMEKILASTQANADRANNLKDAFISNISHEIRTPLNAILGFTDLIREETEGKLSPQVKEYFPIIYSSCQRLMNTVEMILELSKLQTGMFAPTKSMVDPDLIIKSLIEEYQLQAWRKSLSLTYINNAGPIEFHSDAFCIRQAISTLINNAVKYTQEGSVNVSLTRATENLLLLEVADTGIGMHSDYLKRIFQPFSQEETGNTRKFAGIGLSLSITEKLLNAIGAAISVTSEQGKGSVFTITLPVNH